MRPTRSSSYDSLGRVTSEVKTRGETSPYELYERSYLYPLPAPSTQNTLVQTTTYGRSVEEDAGQPEDRITHEVTIDARSEGVNPADVSAVAGLTPTSGDLPQDFTYNIPEGTTGRDLADRVIRVNMKKLQEEATTLSSTYEYNHLGRLERQGGTGLDATQQDDTYEYDERTGRLERRAMEFDAEQDLHGDIEVDYTYAASGRLETTTEDGDSGTTRTHTFNGGGSLLKVERSTTTDFVYTKRQRIKERQSGGSIVEYFEWDKDASNEHLGRRLSEGPSQSNQTRYFDWNDDGTLAEIEDTETGGATSSYTYDGEGQRLSKVVEQDGVTTTIDYTYDGLTLLALSGSIDEGSGETERFSVSYLYDAEGRPYGAYYEQCEVTSGEAVPPPAPGLRRSPTCAATCSSSSMPTVRVSRATATTSGGGRRWIRARPSRAKRHEPITAALAASIAERQEIRYAGYAYDAAHDLYYCSARYYDASTRQFISRDPAKADGAQSAYQYCAGNPVLAADPAGERLDSGDGYSQRLNTKGKRVVWDVWGKARRTSYRKAQSAWYRSPSFYRHAVATYSPPSLRKNNVVAKKDTTVLRSRNTSNSLASAFSTPQGNLGARDAGVRAGKFMAYSIAGFYANDMAQYVGSNGALAIYSRPCPHPNAGWQGRGGGQGRQARWMMWRGLSRRREHSRFAG